MAKRKKSEEEKLRAELFNPNTSDARIVVVRKKLKKFGWG